MPAVDSRRFLGLPDKRGELVSLEILRKYTCDGNDVSPPLRWQGMPIATKAFALLADDPDAPGGTWGHWGI